MKYLLKLWSILSYIYIPIGFVAGLFIGKILRGDYNLILISSSIILIALSVFYFYGLFKNWNIK